jgi:nucleotide-binding universal stress UspA family protein
MYGKMLVTLDGSKAAEIVLPYAEEIAASQGSEIVLVSVSHMAPGDTGNESLYESYLRQTGDRLRDAVKGRRPDSEVKVSAEVLAGEPADEVMRHAEKVKADLIVMASRGSSGPGPWLLGSIAAKVLRATTTPLLLVRSERAYLPIEQGNLIKRILVPLDGSTVGAAAIPYTEALALALDAEIVLLHSMQPAALAFAFPETGTPMQIVGNESSKTAAAAYLDGIKRELSRKGLKVSAAVVMGSAPDQIIDYANANTIDLIAMSSHGRTGFGRWVFGSVTDKILHAGDTPVLVVRPAKT